MATQRIDIIMDGFITQVVCQFFMKNEDITTVFRIQVLKYIYFQENRSSWFQKQVSKYFLNIANVACWIKSGLTLHCRFVRGRENNDSSENHLRFFIVIDSYRTTNEFLGLLSSVTPREHTRTPGTWNSANLRVQTLFLPAVNYFPRLFGSNQASQMVDF